MKKMRFPSTGNRKKKETRTHGGSGFFFFGPVAKLQQFRRATDPNLPQNLARKAEFSRKKSQLRYSSS